MIESKSISERAFHIANYALLAFLCIITIYPFYYVLVASISEASLFAEHRGLLLGAKGFSLEAYRLLFNNPMIATSYMNTLFYVIVGTALNLIFTSLGAFALSRKNVMLRDPMMMIITFTMFFSGGLIPTFLVVNDLGMYDTRWSLIVPVLVSVFNLIVMRTAFLGIPDSLEESAKMDGANDWTVFIRIIIPLSTPVIAVMILFYGVAHWNSYFSALIYLRDRDLYPVQLILREILILEDVNNMTTSVGISDKEFISNTIKYAAIIVVSTPVLVIYPFLQKYFVKGVMVGAIKG
ncbi:carbohydrate ABC transporter permease [Paenibacillus sp. GCM10023252]|uniref:carbohydrate ABC transporter permease n=1 Tax=Paenibacillus sp. GCM10023252 TaxID=3252649 RepID=UPI003614EBB3